jgi:hypothetical protein
MVLTVNGYFRIDCIGKKKKRGKPTFARFPAKGSKGRCKKLPIVSASQIPSSKLEDSHSLRGDSGIRYEPFCYIWRACRVLCRVPLNPPPTNSGGNLKSYMQCLSWNVHKLPALSALFLKVETPSVSNIDHPIKVTLHKYS